MIDIEALAREAGFDVAPDGHIYPQEDYPNHIEGPLARFAAIVAEQTAKIADSVSSESAEAARLSKSRGAPPSMLTSLKAATLQSYEVARRIRSAFGPADNAGAACACTGDCQETGICPVHGGRMGPSREEREAIKAEALADPEVQQALHWWRQMKAKRAASTTMPKE